MGHSITISSGGFLGFYLLGVCTHLKETYDTTSHRVGGVSAGAVVATYMLSDATQADVRQRLMPSMTRHLRTSRVRWVHVPQLVRSTLGELDHVDHARGFVAVSRLTSEFPFLEGEVLEGFSSTRELIDAVVVSAFVPLLCGSLCVERGGARYLDGALTTKMPLPSADEAENNLFIHPRMFGRSFGLTDAAVCTEQAAWRLFSLGLSDAEACPSVLQLQRHA